MTTGAKLTSCKILSIVNSVNTEAKKTIPTIITIRIITSYRGIEAPNSEMLLIPSSKSANKIIIPANAPKTIIAIIAARAKLKTPRKGNC